MFLRQHSCGNCNCYLIYACLQANDIHWLAICGVGRPHLFEIMDTICSSVLLSCGLGNFRAVQFYCERFITQWDDIVSAADQKLQRSMEARLHIWNQRELSTGSWVVAFALLWLVNWPFVIGFGLDSCVPIGRFAIHVWLWSGFLQSRRSICNSFTCGQSIDVASTVWLWALPGHIFGSHSFVDRVNFNMSIDWLIQRTQCF